MFKNPQMVKTTSIIDQEQPCNSIPWRALSADTKMRTWLPVGSYAF
jgi:hypothetical protein